MSDDPIVGYLADFAKELGRLGPRRRRLLAEVEDHLREAAARLEHDGASSDEAARLAVAQFGTPRVVTGRSAGSGVWRAVAEMRALGWRGGFSAGALIVAASLAVVAVGAGRSTVASCAPHLLCGPPPPMHHPLREDGYLAASVLIGLVTSVWLIALGREWSRRHKLAWRGLLVVILVGVAAGLGTGGWVRQHAPRGCPPLAPSSLAGWCQTQSAQDAANRLHRAEWYWLGAAGLSLLLVASVGDLRRSDSQIGSRTTSAISLP
jgi:hypothetical protein